MNKMKIKLNKCFLLLPVLSGLILCLFILTAYAQSDMRPVAEKMVKDIVADSDAAKIKGERIVVAEFENINGKGDAIPRIFQEMLTTAFIKEKHFKVIERAQLEKALKELKMSASSLTDPDSAKKIGKMLGASHMVVGSISEIGGMVSIDARLVNIESGESVTAADASLGGSGSSTASPANTKPTIDLSQSGNSESAGQVVGQVENFGLLGGTNFKIAWREKLGSVPMVAFTSGDIIRDGFPRLGVIKFESISNARLKLNVYKWSTDKFKKTWEDGETLPMSASNKIYLTAPIFNERCSFLASSGYNTNTRVQWQWDANTYQRKDYGTYTSITSTVLGDKTRITGRSYQKGLYVANLNFGIAGLMENVKEIYGPGHLYYNDIVAGDIDNDDQLELIYIGTDKPENRTPIQIFALNGSRKFATESKYDCRLELWKPGNIKYPYIATCQNEIDENEKFCGGTVFLLQWNGETYEEVWKSNKIDDRIQDMQVCDPKGEGKDGLVILSADKNWNMYLTKIVAD